MGPTKQIRGRLRRWLGLPMKPGDSWRGSDGSTLTYLGKAPDPWVEKKCAVCKGPATQYKTTPPWPGTTYAHTAMTCDDHASYLDGMSWSWTADRGHYENPGTSSCATCHGPYGACEHTAKYAVMLAMQEAGAIRGDVK